MHFNFRNVNDAFRGLVKFFSEENNPHIQEVQTRNGPVLQLMQPVITTYAKPTERVLFNQGRDTNCFFSLYEALWMLAGRNDIAPLNYYLGGRYSQFSDDTETANGAYGYRWRHAVCNYTKERQDRGVLTEIDEGPVSVHCKTDQLKVIIEHLKERPTDRRCVLQMWNVEDDLLKMKTSKDVCCNLSVCFSLRVADEILTVGRVRLPGQENFPEAGCNMRLDMTVFNRSNDLANGMLGANVVHFSILQEYMAAQLGVEVGVYNQVSNNLHVYTESFGGFPSEKWLAEYESPETSTATWYTDDATKMVALVDDPVKFDSALPHFVELHSKTVLTPLAVWGVPFFDKVAGPMLNAFHCHKERNYQAAIACMECVQADDWREAGTNWIMKRKINWEAKQNGVE